jgi:serine/arginine repetitive matrix protein 2
MWSRFTGKSDSGSYISKDRDAEVRRRRPSESTRAKRDTDSDMRSTVSSTSTRKPSRRDAAPSSIASFATAFDDRARATDDDLYNDPRNERLPGRRDDRPSSFAEASASTPRRERSRSRDRDEKDQKMSKDKDGKSERRRSTRSDRSGSLSQGGYRGDIVESPRQPTRSFSGQIASESFSQFPGQAGAPLMSGALPTPSRPSHGEMSSHVQDQFPGQGSSPFGAAADYYRDQGESVHQQPGIRPQPPSVIIGQDTPHLVAAAAQANPVADTGSGAAADFYTASTGLPPSKPPRPSTMPGSFYEDEPAPQKPSRPSSKPSKPTKPSKLSKPGKLGSAATLAGGAALGYTMAHDSSSNTHQSSNFQSSHAFQSASYANGSSGPSASTYSMYNHGGNPSNTATDGSNHLPAYSQVMDGAPPPMPPRPDRPEKHSSGSNAGLYAAGAAGLAAYGLHQHNSHSGSHSHSHDHSSSIPGAFPGHHINNGIHSSASPYMTGNMTQRHQHTGPVSRFVDWWKDYEDVQKMEEYTEYIGVCKGCFDPRSSVTDAPRKHHYGHRRSSEYIRPSGGIEKHSRYSLKEKKSNSSFSSGDERRRKHSSNAAGWVAAGLGGIGLAKAGKAVLGTGRADFDDTYSIKSGRDPRSKTSRHSRSRSRDRTDYAYGRSDIRRRSRSRDRMSQMSVGIIKKDYRVIRRHSRSRSRSRSSSSSRDGKTGFGKALGAGLAGAAIGAAVSKKHRSRSRSRSPKKTSVYHRRNSSDEERRMRRSQQLRRKSSRSSASGASVIEISQNQQSQGGFLGGFFAAPTPKVRRKTSFGSAHKKKKKGFFNFGNASSSSSDSEMAFGTGFVRRKRRASPKRRNSEERLKVTLAGLGATAAAIAAAKAARNSGKQSQVVAVKQNRYQRNSSDRPRPASRYGDDEWEDLPDDDTSDSSSNGGLTYGEYDWRKGKSQESLTSNGSGTNKWGWRWGFGQKKRRSSDNLYDNIANTSFIGPATAGAAGASSGVALGSKLGRHDSESSSVHTLQTVYPIASSDPTTFDARRTSIVPTPQPLVTSGPGTISIQQPQPVHQVPGAIYSTQAPSQPSYAAPVGPPVFAQISGQNPHPTQYQTQNVIVQAAQPSVHPPLPRRANSSPIQSSSWGRNMALAGLAGAAGAAAMAAAAKNLDRPPSSPSNVRFDLTKEKADKDERERYRQRERLDEEDRRRREQQRREEEVRKDEEALRIREQQLREAEARRLADDRRMEQLRHDEQTRQEEERRHRELARQQEEARKYMEVEQLARVEAERRADERRRQQDDTRAREAREADERQRREHNAQAEAQRRGDQEAEAERARRERRQAEQREAERVETMRRDAQIQEDLERRRKESEAEDYANRFRSDRHQLEQQQTGSSVSSVATDVRRKEKELERRERDLVRPDTRKSTVGNAIAAGAAAAIAGAAIESYMGKGKEKDSDRDERRNRRRDSSPSVKHVVPSKVQTSAPASVKTFEPVNVKTFEPSSVRTYEPSDASTVGPSTSKVFEPSGVITIAPSDLRQDYADEDIFDPNLFKKASDDAFVNKKQTTRELFQEWEDKYTGPQPTQAEVFAPIELLQNDTLPKVRRFDPNEGAPNITMSEAHEGMGATHPTAPPYPAPYAFVATRDGRPSDQSHVVPALNLIAPTPPGSRAPSVRSASVPPSPNIEPIEETEEVSRPEDLNRARSRVSWGENQFHHFEVPTPDSYREQFISDKDLKDQDQKYSRDEVTDKQNSPGSGQNATTYTPYRPEQAYRASESIEIAPSTQPVRDEKESDWDSIVNTPSKKSSKRDKKKAKAAAAPPPLTAASVAALSQDDWDERKRITSSVISNPFSDTHAAASTIAPSTVSASVPSSSSVYQRTPYAPAPDHDFQTGLPGPTPSSGFVERDFTTEPEQMHIPGSFDEVEDTFDKPSKEERDATATKSEKGKKKLESTYDTVEPRDATERVQPESILRRKEPVRDATPEAEVKVSKKDKKKKSKAGKRASVDSWEESDVSPLSSPSLERNARDMELSLNRSSAPQHVNTEDSPRLESTGSSVAAAAMAGGFAALLGAALKQDQERIASESEHARQSLQSAGKHDSRDTPSSPPNGTRTYENGDRYQNASNAPANDEDFVDAKSPRKKKDKRHSSGRWSPSIGSPLRTETRFEDYMGGATRPTDHDTQSFIEAPKVPTQSVLIHAPQPSASRHVYDSGHHTSDDLLRQELPGRDSDEFFSAGSEERERSRNKVQETDRFDNPPPSSSAKYVVDGRQTVASGKSQYDDDARAVTLSRSKYEDDLDRGETQKQRQEVKPESREQSRDRDYGHDDGGERRRRHRRRETDDPADDWDTRSTISEARSETNGERRRKHKRREGERDESPESTIRSRSSAASEPGDLNDERKSSRRKSKRDDDDNASVISTSSRHDDDRSSKKEKEKRSSGLFGLFSKSKENLEDTSSKSSPSKDDDEEEGKRRRRKHRSDRGSTYGSDDDDARSTISSSSRREKKSSRSERTEGERRDSYDEKVHRSSYAR